MSESQILFETISISILAGIAMQVVAEKLKMPSIVFLMIAGVLLGPEFLAMVQPKTMGAGLEVLVSFAVALILFEGGLSLDFSAFKSVNTSVRNMLTIGFVITILGCALATHYLLNIQWSLSILFGSFMSITGLTVINPILQRVKIKKNIATILRGEGILSNPLGAFVSVGVLEVILATQSAGTETSLVDFGLNFIYKIVIGVVVGYAVGFTIARVVKRKFISDDLKNLVVLAGVFTTYFSSNLVEENTGILAVVIAGLAVQKEDIAQLNQLKRFKGQLSILFISILFILISANLKLSYLSQIGWKGALAIAVVILVVRPLAIFISNRGVLSFKEKLFISWIGPKGIVSASVASLFALILSKNGNDAAVILESLVFLTILVTVTVQGLSARRVAALTDCLDTDSGVLIIGANALGRTLATAFKEIGTDATLVDSNHFHCVLAEAEGLETMHGNCLDPRVLEMAGISKVNTLIATTANSEVNFLVCQMAKDTYQIHDLYPAIDSPEKSVHTKLVEDIGGNLAYAKTVNIQDWKNAVDKDTVKIVDLVLQGAGPGSNKMADLRIVDLQYDDWIPLIIKRKDEYLFVHADQEWSDGDILIYLTKS